MAHRNALLKSYQDAEAATLLQREPEVVQDYLHFLLYSSICGHHNPWYLGYYLIPMDQEERDRIQRGN